jgi:uncharacterized protein (TIGR03086 family)
MDVTEALDQTFTHAHGVITGVSADQYGDKTPCDEWTVRDLLEHMVGVVAGMGAAAAGQPRTPFELAADPGAQFEEVATATLGAWRTPGVLDRVIDGGAGPMPARVLAGINLLDTATHTWDLAVATGQPAELPEDVAVAATEAGHMIVSPELRPGRFGPEQTASDVATTTQRLVAFLGRTP